MLTMDNLSPQDLFSPSKARQQRAQAADWAQIDSWLSYKYAGRTPPTFERNEETLKVLRELASANERADEARMVADRVDREAVKELGESEVWFLRAHNTVSTVTQYTRAGRYHVHVLIRNGRRRGPPTIATFSTLFSPT